MADAGTCPYCKNTIAELNINGAPLRHKEQAWHGVVCSCPSCDAILGVTFDPFALMEDTANKVLAKLKEEAQ